MKNQTLIYCGEDSESVKALEAQLRGTESDVALCSTEYFVGAEIAADRVIIMPDVPFFRAMPIKEAYPNAEYSPPDEFAPKQVKAALAAFEIIHDLPIGGASGVPCMNVTLGENINPAPPRKRGRPRKVIAA